MRRRDSVRAWLIPRLPRERQQAPKRGGVVEVGILVCSRNIAVLRKPQVVARLTIIHRCMRHLHPPHPPEVRGSDKRAGGFNL